MLLYYYIHSARRIIAYTLSTELLVNDTDTALSVMDGLAMVRHPLAEKIWEMTGLIVHASAIVSLANCLGRLAVP